MTKISKKQFKKQFIEVEVMSPATSIVISNIVDKKRNEEFLKLYFTNSKHSGISEYNKLEILGHGQVIIHVQDQKSRLIMNDILK